MNIRFKTQIKVKDHFKTECLENSIDGIQSTNSKKFSRKSNNASRQQPNDNKFKKPQKFIRLGQKKNQSTSTQRKRHSTQKYDYGHVDLALKLIHHTPIKDKYYIATLSSDRATQSTFWLDRPEHNTTPVNNTIDFARSNLIDLKADLDLKINEVMILEDQNMKLKRDISLKESQFYQLKSKLSQQQQKLQKKQQQHHQQMQKIITHITSLQQQSQRLKQQTKGKNGQLRQMKKNQNNLNRQIKSLKHEKLMLQKSLDDIYKRKLPQQLREIISYRQVSLMNQIQEFKSNMSLNKTETQNHLEFQIRKIQQEYNKILYQNNHLSVLNRILNKRICQNDVELNEKMDYFNRSMDQLREENNQLQEKIKTLRKQNMKIKRLNILSANHTNYIKKRRNSSILSSSSDSLSLQLSIN